MPKKFIRPDLRTEDYDDDDTPGLIAFFHRIGSYFHDRHFWRGIAVILALLLLIAAMIGAIIGMVRFFRNVPAAPTHGTTAPIVTTPPTTAPPITTTDPNFPPCTTYPPCSTCPPSTLPPAADLELTINGGTEVTPASLPDALPGDSVMTIFAVQVTHREPARLSIYSEMVSGSDEMLYDVIDVRIVMPNEGITLWEGKLADMFYEITFDDGSDSSHLIIAIVATIPTNIGNEYQGLHTEAKYFWHLEPIG